MTRSSNMDYSSNSNYHAGAGSINMKLATVQHANIRASAYAVDAVTTALSGFHYSSTRAAGKLSHLPLPSIPSLPFPTPTTYLLTFTVPQESSGIPEVDTQGSPTPPRSPPFAAHHTATNKSRTPSPPSPKRGGTSPVLLAQSGKRGPAAAYTITEECERLFCETLAAVFLGEGNRRRDSLVVGARFDTSSDDDVGRARVMRGTYLERERERVGGPGTPPPDLNLDGSAVGPAVMQWIEVWDYAGGTRFRGFVAERPGDRTLFVFFDDLVVGKDLKQGLMALIELASISDFACDQLVVCFDRAFETSPLSKNLLRDLRWVGFELTTLAAWTGGANVVSDKWLFLGMDVSG